MLLGIPPGPDDPVIAQVAPENCVFYTTWAASATPNPHSQNQAEKMLAEPEVRLFLEHLQKWVRHAVTQVSADPEANSLSDATFDTLLMVLRHQTAMFVSEVHVKGKRVSAKGGIVVALGGDALLDAGSSTSTSTAFSSTSTPRASKPSPSTATSGIA